MTAPRGAAAYRTLTILAAVCLVLEPALFSQASSPPVPYEDVGACPYEGCVYREWTGACNVYPERCVGKIVERPRSIWWVQVRNAQKQMGWTDEPQKFEGRDALAGRG